MTEQLLLLVEAALVAGLGVWMSVAVYDNWRHAYLNREAVAMVMRWSFFGVNRCGWPIVCVCVLVCVCVRASVCPRAPAPVNGCLLI